MLAAFLASSLGFKSGNFWSKIGSQLVVVRSLTFHKAEDFEGILMLKQTLRTGREAQGL